ncbi:MAG: hypothetical protein Q8R82_12705, partial [Hyphomonadaceae bacterium]|nr:hypothetical protein [Hyphomonadaceae bacterium]
RRQALRDRGRDERDPPLVDWSGAVCGVDLSLSTIDGLLHRLSEEIGREFLIGDLALLRDGRSERDVDLENAHIAVVSYFGALARISSTLDDIGKLPRFGRRYVWDPRILKRSDHIRFVWMTFLHLVYVYHERVRLFLRRIDEASKYVALSHVVDFGAEMGALRKVIGDYVRERGEATHEWSTERREANVLEMVEMLAIDGDPKWDVVGHYRETRETMLGLIERDHREASRHFDSLVARHDPALRQLVEQFIELRELAIKDGIAVQTSHPAHADMLDGRSFFRDRYGRKS